MLHVYLSVMNCAGSGLCSGFRWLVAVLHNVADSVIKHNWQKCCRDHMYRVTLSFIVSTERIAHIVATPFSR